MPSVHTIARATATKGAKVGDFVRTAGIAWKNTQSETTSGTEKEYRKGLDQVEGRPCEVYVGQEMHLRGP